MDKEIKQEILRKIEVLIDLPICEDKKYIRKPIKKGMREIIINKQGKICFLCGVKTTSPLTHHIIPNGNSSEDNLIMLCPTCHSFVHRIIHKYLGYKDVVKWGFN